MEESAYQNAQIPPPPPLPHQSSIGLFSFGSRKRKKILFSLICIFIVILLALAALPVYANVQYPFLGDTQRKALLSFFYAIPFIPKTNEQILHAATSSNYQIHTYQPDFSLSAQLRNSTISLASLDMDIAGQADISPNQKSKVDLNVTADVTFAGTKYNMTGKVRKLNDTFYFKIDTLPDSFLSMASAFSGTTTGSTDAEKAEIKQNLQQALQYWIMYDTSGLSTEARKAIEPTSQQSVAESTRTSFENFLLQKDILQAVQRMPDEQVASVDCYHLQFIPDKTLLTKVVKDYIGLNKSLSATDAQNLVTLTSDSIDNLAINLWIGKWDSVMRKFTFASDIDLGQYFKNSALSNSSTIANVVPSAGSASDYLGMLGSSQFATSKLSIATALVLSKIGQPVTIVAPTPVKNPTDYTTNLLNSLKTKEALAREQQQKQKDAQLQSVQSALSTYFADNGSYPASLNQLQAKDLAISHLTQAMLSAFQYKQGVGGKSYALYTTITAGAITGNETPYYGITSVSSYPHQLTTSDFDDLNNPNPTNYNFLLAPVLKQIKK